MNSLTIKKLLISKYKFTHGKSRNKAVGNKSWFTLLFDIDTVHRISKVLTLLRVFH